MKTKVEFRINRIAEGFKRGISFIWMLTYIQLLLEEIRNPLQSLRNLKHLIKYLDKLR